MTKLELQNKIATIEKSMAKITNPAVLAIAEKNLKEAREQLAALEGAMPSPAPSGGGSELEKLYEQRERLTKGLQSSNAVVQKASKMALPKVEAKIAELEGASPAPAPARRMPKPKAETPEVPATKAMPTPAKRGRKPSPPAPMPIPTPAKRGRKPKAEAPMPMPTPAKRGRKPKAEAPAEVKGKIKRGRKPKVQAPAEAPAVTPARRGRPALPKGAKSQEVSLNSLTKLANAIVEFCRENGIANPTIDDVRGILGILDKGKALKFAKGGKISRSGKYLSKWQIKQILTDGGMKIGSDEILSGVWLKKKVNGVAEMRMGGEIGYFVIDDDILESGKSVMLGNRRISAKNKKFQGVFEGKMVGGLMKVYDYDDEMWKVVNPDEWQQAYAEGGGVYDSADGISPAKQKAFNSLQNEGYFEKEAIEYVGGIKEWNKLSATEKEIIISDIEKDWSKSTFFAEGGGVGRKLDFESREYDMPRGKTIYSVEVENEYDDDETITEEYDNYDEAISAYRRSKLRFPITWRTYLETQKPPFVYESGIVLQDGTLKVISRKGKDVNYDFNGNEKYAEGGGVGIDYNKFLKAKTDQYRKEGYDLIDAIDTAFRDLGLETDGKFEKREFDKVVNSNPNVKKAWLGYKKESEIYLKDGYYVNPYQEQYAKGGGVDLGTNSDDTPKVWVGEWSLYNEGKLMGEWIDLTDFDSGAEVMERISELMNELTEKTGELREEYAVFDYENFPRSMYSEQMGEKEFDDVIKAYKISQDRDMPIDVIGDIMREYSPYDIEEFIDENYEGYFDSEEDLAYHIVDVTGGIENFSKDTLEMYFDYESFGRDLSINDYREFDGHYFRIYKRGGQLKSDYKKHLKKTINGLHKH